MCKEERENMKSLYLLPDSSLVHLCVEQGPRWKAADSLKFVLDGETTQIHKLLIMSMNEKQCFILQFGISNTLTFRATSSHRGRHSFIHECGRTSWKKNIQHDTCSVSRFLWKTCTWNNPVRTEKSKLMLLMFHWLKNATKKTFSH